MTHLWRSLRLRLAVLGFLAIYVPVLMLFGVILVTDTDTVVEERAGVETVTTTSQGSGWGTMTVLLLGPVAAALAWWLAGRAVHPFERIRAVTEEIGEGDLSRRIRLTSGPSELIALAASFDGMLERLDRAARVQRELIEETSHELRTPLAVLMMNADVMLAHPEPTLEIYRRGLEGSQAAAVRLQATIDELLVDARGRARNLDRHPTDLMTLVREVVRDAAVLAAGRRTRLRCTGPATAMSSVDVPSVRRAISNLLDNAIIHGPAGSTVDLVVEETGDHVAVTVIDHGPGIPVDQHDQVRQRFWRGSTDGAGTGLGLTIADHVALAHGGHLRVTSPGSAGDGSEFRLSLPRIRSDAPPPPVR